LFRRVSSLAVTVAVLCIFAACGRPDYRYVSNRTEGNFFKVPSEWTYASLTEKDKAGRPEGLPAGIESTWHVGFTNAANGTPAVDSQGVPTNLEGEAQIFRLSNYYREQRSLSSLRADMFFGVDPVYPPDQLTARVELVSYSPLTSESGLSGARVVANVNIKESGDPDWVTVDNSMLFDDTQGRVFSLTMRCQSECYIRDRAAADAIASSWKVKKP
jgi:hypothetical protein